MSNEVAVRGNTAMAIPADLASMFGALAPNIQSGEPTPHLSIGGKVWKVCIGGDEKPVMAMVDGEPMPAPTVKVVILNQVPKRSRAYFEGAFTEGSSSAPVCWSVNGDTPDEDVAEPQASRCDACPQSVKGSKVTENGPTTACASSKRIAVVPSNKPDFTALLCKLAVTSLWDGEPKEEAQGWYSFDAYLKHLKANGVTHTAMVETTMKFDSSVNYPKVLFKFGGFINAETAAVIAPRVESDEVLKVLGLLKDPDAPKRGKPAEKPQETHKVADKPVETPKSTAAVVDDGFGGAAEAPKETPKAEPKATKPRAKKEEPKAEVAQVAEGDDDLSSLLASWE